MRSGLIRRYRDVSAALRADWDEYPWCRLPALKLDHYIGEKPDHFPTTHVRRLYDPDGLCLHFRVEDRYVRAITQQHQGKVYKDSCVEFFFSPSARVADGYFNLEMNCFIDI